ncbi:N-acetylmuramoyl-L-alanine amidase, partial [bacterium]|nr:N-acetylmuramoyl-L-alanine amidase [bacterium]
APAAIILHHSWIPTVAQYNGASTIRGIQNYHMNDVNTGWADIGYHFLIGPDGLIYRGRPENAIGAHCIPNSDKIGICCIGNFDPEKDPLPEKTYESLKKLLPYLASKYKVSTSMLFGHRDFSPKTCPGETVYQKLPELKKVIETDLGIK